LLVSINNENCTNFRAIKLSESEIKKSENIIQGLVKSGISSIEKNHLQRKLFDIFSPHIYKESVLKSKSYYIFDDVLSEMYLKFSELLNNIKKNTSLETFVNTLNEYFPSRETRKGKYFYRTTDKDHTIDLLVFREQQELDNIDNKSAEVTAKKKNLNKHLKKVKISDKAQSRFQQKLSGLNYSEIGRREDISHSSARASVMKVVIKMQDKEGTLPKNYSEKARSIAEVLDCNETTIIKAAFKWPTIFDQNPETIEARIKQSAELLKCSLQDFKKAVVKEIQLSCINPETLQNNITKLSQLLKCPKDKLVKTALHYPQIFYRNPEVLNNNMEQLAQSLKCTKVELINAIFRQPILLCRTPESIISNVTLTSELLGCPPEEFTKTALKQPSLFMRTPKSIEENVNKSAELLKCTKEEFTSAGLKHGALFTIRPETLFDNAQKTATLLNMSEATFIQSALRKPSYFCMKPESLLEKRKILNYYKKLQNLPPANIINVQSNKSLYSEIIRLLIQKTDPENPSYYVKAFNFEAFLKANADKSFCFDIPNDEIVPNFIKFIQDTSQNTINKNIFEFKVTD